MVDENLSRRALLGLGAGALLQGQTQSARDKALEYMRQIPENEARERLLCEPAIQAHLNALYDELDRKYAINVGPVSALHKHYLILREVEEMLPQKSLNEIEPKFQNYLVTFARHIGKLRPAETPPNQIYAWAMNNCQSKTLMVFLENGVVAALRAHKDGLIDQQAGILTPPRVKINHKDTYNFCRSAVKCGPTIQHFAVPPLEIMERSR